MARRLHCISGSDPASPSPAPTSLPDPRARLARLAVDSRRQQRRRRTTSLSPGDRNGTATDLHHLPRRFLDLMAQRAKWNSRFEKGLVDILTEYRGSHYRGQNGWCTEGWKRIVKDFNEHFPEANFSKAKIRDKESELKKDYKAIKAIRNRSGVSWNQEASIINTTAAVWDDIIGEDPKYRKYENKSFPLFDSLDYCMKANLLKASICLLQVNRLLQANVLQLEEETSHL